MGHRPRTLEGDSTAPFPEIGTNCISRPPPKGPCAIWRGGAICAGVRHLARGCAFARGVRRFARGCAVWRGVRRLAGGMRRWPSREVVTSSRVPAEGRKLLSPIPAELVFEVPREHADAFLTEMKRELERPPTPEFRVPIVVEAKRGVKFGDLVEFPAPRKPGCWFTGLRAWLGRLVARARRLVVRVWSFLCPGAPASP